jgi:gamma-glutamylcyclotransferase (GGCT)/AIG2-like uncharacterized protein YtfP
METARLFVYGTLMPGEESWHLLSPLAASGVPEPATAAGALYRTPYGWPAAVLDAAAPTVVPGLVVTLRDPGRALPVLDEFEGTGRGLFERRLIKTSAGPCWAYHWPGPTVDFRAITSWAVPPNTVKLRAARRPACLVVGEPPLSGLLAGQPA